MVKYDLPLNEVVFDFYDRLKSVSKGYASFDYHLTDDKPADLVKMQILVNNEPVDGLSMLVHRTRAEGSGIMGTSRRRRIECDPALASSTFTSPRLQRR
jgi:GTP-binding protein LepA